MVTKISTLTRLALALMLTASTVSCKTQKSSCKGSDPLRDEKDSIVIHDTVRLSDIRYDSIFIDRFQGIETRNDTVFVTNNLVRYRDRIRHDTVRQVVSDVRLSNDTIRVPYEVVVTKPPSTAATLKAALWMTLSGLILIIFLYFLAKKALTSKLA